ncbi:hypothetical protein [Streptomyces sp. NPDC058632]|uniref:hypothetical protein n=1 Tax=Streptomyces sp. NPDC058632 TaxID=3346567 RepID=UPI0036599B63
MKSTAAPAGPSGARFHGWRMVAYCALAMAMTAPGQTTGVSVFIDPLIADLGVSRTQVSTAYLTGTLVGACVMPLVGRAIDRHGPRRVTAAVGAAFGTILLALSFVTGLVGLTAGFVGIRMAGEFSAAVRLEMLPYHLARATDAAGAEALNRSRIVKGEALTRIRDKAQLALFPDRWQANSFRREFPDARLEHLVAAHD